ncbi:hypothetical protein BH11PSE12_BH11PSE12_09040 [soil metagenome]
MASNRIRKKQHQQRYQRKYWQGQQGVLALRRQDAITRMLVDVGIHYASTLGIAKTAEFLRQKNVPEPVIVRVLHRA